MKILKVAGLNHLSQRSDKGLPLEYGEKEETYSPDILNILTDWISDQD